jgi:hypothetical protein
MITSVETITHEATPDAIKIEGASIHKSKMSALKKREDWIGTIHSHCFVKNDPTCWHLSRTDMLSAMQYGETVCGLVFVTKSGGKRTSVHWYVPHPMPEVVYE